MRASGRILALSIIVAALAAAPAHGSHGPSTIRSLVIDRFAPNTLYAGTDSGVVKSVDGGATWSPIGLTNSHIGAVVIDPLTPTTLYTFPYDAGGVFKTVDAGVTWSPTALPATQILAIDPMNPNILYSGAGGAVFKTTDGGATWHNLGFPQDWVTSIAVDPVTPGTVCRDVLERPFQESRWR